MTERESLKNYQSSMPNLFKEIKVIIENYELLLKLAGKEIKIRYKHPLLGFLWALILPLAIVLIFKLIFSDILKISLQGFPFFIFLASAVFPWNFFSLSVSNSTLSIQENSSLIKKVYFPRELIPLSIITANLINFLLSLLVIFPIFVTSNFKFNHFLLLLPLVILLQVIFTIGVSLIFSGLQAQFRDIKYIVEILLLIWFYLTPVFYSLNVIYDLSKTFFTFYMLLNPLSQLITLYRGILLNGYFQTLPPGISIWHLVFLSIFSSFLTFFIGFWIFKKFEPKFADLI